MRRPLRSDASSRIAARRSSVAGGQMRPVGLFGLFTMTMRVRGVMAAISASTSQRRSSVTGVSGQLNYNDKVGDVKVQSQSVSSLTVTGNRATFTGSCTVNKVSGFTFTVDVVDNGSGSTDTFRIRLSNGYDAGGTLGGGNVTVE